MTRDNQAGMTAVFRAVSGSVSAPGITFNSDTTSGLYLSASGAPGFVSHSLGMILNTNNFAATSAVISAGGSGYAVGDTITLTGGTAVSQPVFVVATLSGSAVATVTVGYPGSYSTKPANPVAQGSTSGSGTGCTLTVTYNDPTSSDYRAIFTDQAAALIWQKLGSSSFMSGLMAKAKAYDVVQSLVTISTGLSISSATDPPTLTAPAVPVQGSYKNLVIKVASNTTVTAAADAVVVSDATNYRSVVVSSTINLGTNGGVNALDTGTIASATWYYIWAIQQTASGGTIACLASLSATSPTMPAGYTYKARIGAVRTAAGSAQLLGTWQFGNRAQYVNGLAQCTALPILASQAGSNIGVPGTTGAATWVAVSVSNFVPTTASTINGVMVNGGSGVTTIVAPNNSYGAISNTTNPAPVSLANTAGAFAAQQFSFVLESTNIYWAANANANSLLQTVGWVDQLP